jgi:AraC-like DNA-binding protein
MERARVLLESTDMSVREIAERLAFNTVNYFIQSFRETTGMTPAAYRKSFRKLG